MKGIIRTPIYLTKLFPKNLSDKIKDIPLTKEAKKRLKWIEYYLKSKNVSKTCRYFGISRNTFYKWLKRYQKEGLEGLYDKSRTPKNTRKPTVRNKYRDEIIKVRKENPVFVLYIVDTYTKKFYHIP